MKRLLFADGSSSSFSFSFLLPSCFHEVPFGANEQSAWEALAANLAEVSSVATESLALVSDLRRLLIAPVVHASVCGMAEGTAPVGASLLAYLRSASSRSVATRIASIERSLVSRDLIGGQAKTITLPCGPAVGAVGCRRVSLGGDGPSSAKIAVMEYAVHVPHPSSADNLTLLLSTPTLSAAAFFGEVLGSVARSIEFVTPLSSREI